MNVGPKFSVTHGSRCRKNGRSGPVILLSVFALLLFCSVASAKVLFTDLVREEQSLIEYCSWLLDADGESGITDVSSQEFLLRFKPMSEGPPIKGGGPFWMRMEMERAPRGVDASFLPDAKARLIMNLGQLPAGRTRIFFSEYSSPVATQGVWHSEYVSSNEDILLPNPDKAPLIVYVRMEESPGLWFAPTVRPQAFLPEAVFPPELLLPGILIATAIVCLLRTLAYRQSWTLWAFLFLVCVLIQTRLSPAPGVHSFGYSDLPALLAPGISLILLAHIARCMFPQPELSRYESGTLSAITLFGAHISLLPLLPGFSWLTRLFPLWPLVCAVLFPLCTGFFTARRPGSLAHSILCIFGLVGGAVSLYGVKDPDVHPLVSQAGLWGIAIGSIGLVLARLPRKDLKRRSKPGIAVSESFAGRAPALAGTAEGPPRYLSMASSGNDVGQAVYAGPMRQGGANAGESSVYAPDGETASAADDDPEAVLCLRDDWALRAQAGCGPNHEYVAARYSSPQREPDAPHAAAMSGEQNCFAPDSGDADGNEHESVPEEVAWPVEPDVPENFTDAMPEATADVVPEELEPEAASPSESFMESGVPMVERAHGVHAASEESGQPEVFARLEGDPVESHDELPPPAGGVSMISLLEGRDFSIQDRHWGALGSEYFAAAENQVFDLPALVRDIYQRIAPEAESKGLFFSWFMAPSLPPSLEGCASLLRDALALLLQNAVLATDAGTVQLSVRQMPDSRMPGDVFITIFDSGSSERTDLGFAQARAFADAAGGNFIVEHSPGSGTLMSLSAHFTVPATDVAQSLPSSGGQLLLGVTEQEAPDASQPPLELTAYPDITGEGLDQDLPVVSQDVDVASSGLPHVTDVRQSPFSPVSQVAAQAGEASVVPEFVMPASAAVSEKESGYAGEQGGYVESQGNVGLPPPLGTVCPIMPVEDGVTAHTPSDPAGQGATYSIVRQLTGAAADASSAAVDIPAQFSCRTGIFPETTGAFSPYSEEAMWSSFMESPPLSAHPAAIAWEPDAFDLPAEQGVSHMDQGMPGSQAPGLEAPNSEVFGSEELSAAPWTEEAHPAPQIQPADFVAEPVSQHPPVEPVGEPFPQPLAVDSETGSTQIASGEGESGEPAQKPSRPIIVMAKPVIARNKVKPKIKITTNPQSEEAVILPDADPSAPPPGQPDAAASAFVPEESSAEPFAGDFAEAVSPATPLPEAISSDDISDHASGEMPVIASAEAPAGMPVEEPFADAFAEPPADVCAAPFADAIDSIVESFTEPVEDPVSLPIVEPAAEIIEEPVVEISPQAPDCIPEAAPVFSELSDVLAPEDPLLETATFDSEPIVEEAPSNAFVPFAEPAYTAGLEASGESVCSTEFVTPEESTPFAEPAPLVEPAPSGESAPSVEPVVDFAEAAELAPPEEFSGEVATPAESVFPVEPVAEGAMAVEPTATAEFAAPVESEPCAENAPTMELRPSVEESAFSAETAPFTSAGSEILPSDSVSPEYSSSEFLASEPGSFDSPVFDPAASDESVISAPDLAGSTGSDTLATALASTDDSATLESTSAPSGDFTASEPGLAASDESMTSVPASDIPTAPETLESVLTSSAHEADITADGLPPAPSPLPAHAPMHAIIPDTDEDTVAQAKNAGISRVRSVLSGLFSSSLKALGRGKKNGREQGDAGETDYSASLWSGGGEDTGPSEDFFTALEAQNEAEAQASEAVRLSAQTRMAEAVYPSRSYASPFQAPSEPINDTPQEIQAVIDSPASPVPPLPPASPSYPPHPSPLPHPAEPITPASSTFAPYSSATEEADRPVAATSRPFAHYSPAPQPPVPQPSPTPHLGAAPRPAPPAPQPHPPAPKVAVPYPAKVRPYTPAPQTAAPVPDVQEPPVAEPRTPRLRVSYTPEGQTRVPSRGTPGIHAPVKPAPSPEPPLPVREEPTIVELTTPLGGKQTSALQDVELRTDWGGTYESRRTRLTEPSLRDSESRNAESRNNESYTAPVTYQEWKTPLPVEEYLHKTAPEPIAEIPPPPSPRPREKREAVLGPPRKVIIGETTTSNKRLIAHYLADMPHEAVNIENNSEIRDIFAEADAALLVLDADTALREVSLVIKDVRKIEEQLGLAPAGILCLTALPSQTGRLLDAGASHCLTKPFAIDAFVRAVAQIAPGLSSPSGPGAIQGEPGLPSDRAGLPPYSSSLESASGQGPTAQGPGLSGEFRAESVHRSGLRQNSLHQNNLHHGEVKRSPLAEGVRGVTPPLPPPPPTSSDLSPRIKTTHLVAPEISRSPKASTTAPAPKKPRVRVSSRGVVIPSPASTPSAGNPPAGGNGSGPAQNVFLPGIGEEALDVAMMPLVPGLLHFLENTYNECLRGTRMRDNAQVADAGARLAGRAETFGLGRLGKLARCVERAARADDQEAIHALVEDLDPLVEAYMVGLRKAYEAFLIMRR